MNWVDVTIAAIFLLVVLIEAQRGFARAGLDALSLGMSAYLAPKMQMRPSTRYWG